MTKSKLVPIAIEYNYLGTFQTVRCLSIPDNDLSGAKVVHLDPYSLNFNETGFAVEQESNALNIKGIKDITRVDASGKVYNECAQVIFFDDKKDCYQPQEVVDVVDYNGKLFRLSVQQLSTLVHGSGVKLGNAQVEPQQEIIYRGASLDNAHSEAQQGTLYRYPPNDIFYEYTFSGPNIYKKELEATALLTGQTLSKPDFLTLDRSSINGSNILIPQGISDAEINDTVGSLVRVISCPDLMASFSCNLQGVVLDALKSPKIVYDYFSLICHSVKNLALPTRLATAELNEVNKTLYELRLDTFYGKILQLESTTMNININIANAPNLESCVINLITPNVFYGGDKLGLILSNAPRLKKIDIINTIGPKVCSISENSGIYMVLRGITSDVEVNAHIPISIRRIRIRSDNASLVHGEYVREGYTRRLGGKPVNLPNQRGFIQVEPMPR